MAALTEAQRNVDSIVDKFKVGEAEHTTVHQTFAVLLGQATDLMHALERRIEDVEKQIKAYETNGKKPAKAADK